MEKHAYLIKQDLILLLHTRHEGILGQIIRHTRILLIRPLGLLLQTLNPLRQQTRQIKLASLLGRVRGPFVEVGVIE